MDATGRHAISPFQPRAGIDVRARTTLRELAPSKWRGMVGRPGFVDEMAERHPRFARAMFDLKLGVADADWMLRAVEDETPAEEEFREQLREVLWTECVTDAKQLVRSLRGNWRKAIMQAAGLAMYGHAYFERSWYDDPSALAGQGKRLELYLLQASTISEYVETADGVLTHIRQSGRRRVDVPAEKLVAIVPFGDPGQWEGWTPVRSLGFLLEVAWALGIAKARQAHNAGGVMAVEETVEGAFTANYDELDYILDEFSNGRTQAMRLPLGVKANFFAPAGNGAEADATWRYIDGAVDHVIGAWVASLGLTAGSGSRALGETLSVEDAKRWERFLGVIGDGLGSMFEDIRDDLGYGSDVRVPTLTVRGQEQQLSLAEFTASVQVGLTTGALQVTPGLSREWAERTGLSEEVVDEIAAMPAPAPSPAPVAPTAEFAADPHDDGCACGSCGAPTTFAADVVDYNGEPVEFDRDLSDIEAVVEWNALEREREELDAEFQRVLAALRDEQVAALRAALQLGNDDAVERLIESFGVRYSAALSDYLVRILLSAGTAGTLEAGRLKIAGTPPTPEAIDRMRRAAADIVAGLQSGAGRQGDIAARRVHEDVVDQYEAGRPIAQIESRITDTGLFQHGRGLGNRAESMGRIVMSQADPDGGGLVPVEAFRTSVRDKRRCEVCKERDSGVSGKTWPLVTEDDIAAFEADPEALVPDPDCKGSEKHCRCGHLLRYARLDGDRVRSPVAGEIRTLRDLRGVLAS